MTLGALMAANFHPNQGASLVPTSGETAKCWASFGGKVWRNNRQ
jgi:hypothetical protein